MNNKIGKIKEIINEIIQDTMENALKNDYTNLSKKIRAIDDLLHAITLIEEK